MSTRQDVVQFSAGILSIADNNANKTNSALFVLIRHFLTSLMSGRNPLQVEVCFNRQGAEILVIFSFCLSGLTEKRIRLYYKIKLQFYCLALGQSKSLSHKWVSFPKPARFRKAVPL